MTQLARATGRLLKGGEPDLNTTARRVLLDWQRGKLPFFNVPPDYEIRPPAGESEAVGATEQTGLPAEEVRKAWKYNACLFDADAQDALGSAPHLLHEKGHESFELLRHVDALTCTR